MLVVCADWFAPGIRAGGPIKSCVNLAMLLGESTEVLVVTSNRDLGAESVYEGLPSDSWVTWRDRARVLYCNGTFARMKAIAKALRSHPQATVYLNSMFSVAGALWPLLWSRLTGSRRKIVLAPRGMLKASALNQKRWKKIPLLRMIWLFGLVKRVTFHATSTDEIEEINEAFGRVDVRMISNVPTMPVPSLPVRSFLPATAKLCFVGRVHPIKNLKWLLETIREVRAKCCLTVVGPIEDEAYYGMCQSAIEELPDNVLVEFVGPKSEEDLTQVLMESDAMILPTHGENFGHAIFESLAVGTPVVISDRTIWTELKARQAGWDISLENAAGFVAAIESLAEMSEEEHHSLRLGALKVATDFVEQNEFEEDYKQLFFHNIL